MIRTIAKRLTKPLGALANSTRYPTRTVEFAFAWIIVVWSYSTLMHPEMLNASVFSKLYDPMLALMSPQAWGWIGMMIGLTRIVALIANGHLRPGPELRLLGAAWGLMFWTIMSYCYYLAVEINGGLDFPMRRALVVFMFFEIYSCYRCGQDIGKRQREDVKTKGSEPSRSMDAGYG